jgi:hypothetical protein
MSQDLKKLFEQERKKAYQMPKGHERRFESRLDEAFSQRKRSPRFWIGIAASVVALLGLGIWSYWTSSQGEMEQPIVVQQDSIQPQGFSLGDLSPDLRKLEQYYTTSINMELANLDISGEHKNLADDYLKRLRELDGEYQNLNRELNEIGPNEETITAMIRNFQLRLDLLLKLKEKLNELKQSKNETVTTRSA